MRGWFGIVSLVLALWWVSTLVQRQMSALAPAPAAPGAAQERKPQQVQQQVQEALDQALQHNQRKLDAAVDGDR